MAIFAPRSSRTLWVTLGVSLALGGLGGRAALADEATKAPPDASVSPTAEPAPTAPVQAPTDPTRASTEPTPAQATVDDTAEVGDAAQAAEEARAAEAKRLRSEAAIAFARRRIRQMAARKQRAEERAEAQRHAAASAPSVSAPPPPRPPAELPTIVDHRSALERQLAAGWGWGADPDRQVRVPLPDWQNWRQVRFFGIEHVAAFTYTKDHHTLSAVFAVETRADKPSSLSCMEEFERRGMPEIKRQGVDIEPIAESASRWEERPVVVHKTEGHVSILFSHYEFSAAWTAYPAYDHGCLVHATVVLWDGHPELARKLLDRFVVEGVGQVRRLTTELPARQLSLPNRVSKLAASGKPRAL